MSDYLWDRTGEPDAEVERLESLLGAARYRPRPLELPSEESPHATTIRGASHVGAFRRLFVPTGLLRSPARLAAAAVLLFVFMLGAAALLHTRLLNERQRVASSQTEAPSDSEPARDTRRELARADSLVRSESTPAGGFKVSDGRVPESGRGEVEGKGATVKKGVEGVAVRDAGQGRRGARLASLQKQRQRPETAGGEDAKLFEAMRAEGGGAASLFDATRLLTKERLVYALRLTGSKLKEVESKTRGADEAEAGARARQLKGQNRSGEQP
jgi:hypothetical protein